MTEEPKVTVSLPSGLSPEDAQKIFSKISKVKEPNKDPIVFLELGEQLQQVRLHISYYKGKGKCRLQNFWREDTVDEWKFGKAISFNFEDIDLLISSLQEMKAYIEDHPEAVDD